MIEALSFLVAPGNTPFAISGAVLLLLLAIEVIGLLAVGMGVSSVGDLLNAEGDADGLDLGGLAGDALGYLHWGKVPILIILALLTGTFSIAGYGLQGLISAWFGSALPGWLAAIPAGGAAVFSTHFLAAPIARLMPSGSGDAPTEKGMLGLVGDVVLGPIAFDRAGEVRVRDVGGREHFIAVKADAPGVEIPKGAEIVVTGLSDSFFRVGVTALSAGAPVAKLPAKSSGDEQ